ncbi:MAG: type II secretion system GspH family protein [Kiritimatiellae bacterium]|nr:type II secretion system GspH family protein [Kiritimatiellia bacterium]
MKSRSKSGFTLIELLVVVAIIAVIGAGVAVTYKNLDDRAKTAMEISDIGILQKTIGHWSFLHDEQIPNRLDSLIGTDGNLYSQASRGMAMGMGASAGNGKTGLYAQGMFTPMAKKAPDRVISNLAAAGLSLVYLHDTAAADANESTYRVTSEGQTADMDTTETAATLESTEGGSSSIASDTTAREAANAMVDTYDEAYAAFWDTSAETPSERDGASFTVGDDAGSYAGAYSSWSAYKAKYDEAKEIAEASRTCDTLAFVYPGGGAQSEGNAMAMNYTDKIISNIGLKPEDVARPDEDASAAAAAGRKYWLVAFGIGRFADIYSGKSVRVDAPAASKRYSDNVSIYSRYIAIVRVPVEAYNSMTRTTEAPQVAAVLSPQFFSASELGRKYREDVNKTNN